MAKNSFTRPWPAVSILWSYLSPCLPCESLLIIPKLKCSLRTLGTTTFPSCLHRAGPSCYSNLNFSVTLQGAFSLFFTLSLSITWLLKFSVPVMARICWLGYAVSLLSYKWPPPDKIKTHEKGPCSLCSSWIIPDTGSGVGVGGGEGRHQIHLSNWLFPNTCLKQNKSLESFWRCVLFDFNKCIQQERAPVLIKDNSSASFLSTIWIGTTE